MLGGGGGGVSSKMNVPRFSDVELLMSRGPDPDLIRACHDSAVIFLNVCYVLW